MANYLMAKEPQDLVAIERHLRGSYSSEDQDFEARFTLAQFLFSIGEVGKAADLFSEIHKKAPIGFRKFAPRQDNIITDQLPIYSGNIDTIRETHCFIRSGAYPDKIFSHRSAYDDDDAENVAIGAAVNFRIRFNRSGPVAVSVSLKELSLAS